MRARLVIPVAAVFAGAVAFGAVRVRAALDDAPSPAHALPTSKSGDLVVGLCDGETSIEVAGVKEGETMDRAKAQAVSDALMAEWRRKNPSAKWEDAPVRLAALDEKASGAPPADAPPAAPPGTLPLGGTPEETVQTGTYGDFGQRDEKVWRAATDTFVADGNKIFHDVKALGGTIGVSCDMCHPDGSNTHPETYPKYQVQLGRVAMLRDMINWCIENPVRGKPLPDGDVKMKALEAYILAQRKGVALDYGKH